MIPLLLACTPPPGPPERNGAAVTVPVEDTGSDEPADPSGGPPADPPDPPTDFPTVDGGTFDLCINELSPNTRISFLDEEGVPSDWIELHNPTDADVALDGWTITDDPAE